LNIRDILLPNGRILELECSLLPGCKRQLFNIEPTHKCQTELLDDGIVDELYMSLFLTSDNGLRCDSVCVPEQLQRLGLATKMLTWAVD